MGRGFYVLDNIQTIRTWKKMENESDFIFLKPNPQYRMRYQASSSTDMTKYPSPAVFFEYYIPNQKENDE